LENKIKGSAILVTGGAGFIGSYVTEELLRYSPSKVYVIDNLIRGSVANMKAFIDNPLVEFIEGDINDNALLEKYISQSDYVFHMAALRINACAENTEKGFETMVRATLNLAELSVKHKVKKVIYSSSASIYGLAQNFPTTESDNPYNNQTFYGAAKLFGEQLFRSYKYMYGLDFVALRYFNVYGPRMDTNGKYTEVMIKWMDCIRDNIPPEIHGDGSTTMDFVYVTDVAEANISSLISDVTDENFNIGCSRETSLKELLETLLKINKSNLKPVYIESNKVNPVGRRLSDNSKAEELIGFTPKITLEEGLKRLSQWYYEKLKFIA
jgi:UDP-glucose 4-epimerase